MLSNTLFVILVTVTMAERNDDNELTKLHSELIEKFSCSDKDSTDDLGPQLTELLEKLKCTDRRKQLDALLGKMNQILSHLDSVKRTLETDKLAFPGEMSCDKVINIAIEECGSKIAEIHYLVIECLKNHTEIYFMIEDVSEFITNFENFELDISALSKLFNPKVLEVLNYLSIGLTFTGASVGMGGVKCAIIKGGGRLTTNGIPIILSTLKRMPYLPIAIGLLLAIVGGVSWYYLSKQIGKPQDKHKLLQDIHKICKELEDKNILGQLRTFRDQFYVQRERLKANLCSKSCADLNIIMKCYKDYKRGMEEILNKPSNSPTEDKLSDMLATLYSIPLRDRFNLSDTDAKKLFLAFLDTVTRKKLNDS